MGMRRSAFLALLLFVVSTVPARAQVMTYVYDAPESPLDVRYLYHWEILRTALERTTPKWGKYRMMKSELMTERRRAFELQIHNGR
ncbi:MAG TPA: hypothetical protein VLC46_27745 [Thermoanaerobaculia bacterium]|nr:hypothetical protein [Thermoanaerobaculia bacterium]